MAWQTRCGSVLLPQGRLAEVTHRMQTALAYDRAQGHKDGINISLMTLALVAVQHQDYNTARQHIHEVIRVAEAGGLRRNEVEGYFMLGTVNVQAGDYEMGQNALEKGLAQHAEYGIDAFFAASHAELGHLALARDDSKHAQEHFCVALQNSRYPGPRLSAALEPTSLIDALLAHC